MIHYPDRFLKRYSCDRRLMNSRETKRSGNDVFTDERAHTIMNGHQSIVFNFLQSIFYGLETRFSSVLQDQRPRKFMPFAECMPGLHVVLREHQYQVDVFRIPIECL